MRFSKVLLLFPDYAGSHFGGHLPPAGLGYLAQTLENNGVDYDVVDMSVGYGMGYLMKKMAAYQPDLVAVSMMSYLHQRHYEIVKNIKDKFGQVAVVAGGPHVSTLRTEVLAECPQIDFGIVLEGERTLLELCQGKDLEEIGGLIYRRNGRVVFNGERPFIQNLDEIPFPRFHKFPLKRYVTEEIGIVSSRGCPSNCIYCPVTTSIGKRFRARSARSVADEIEFWYRRGYRQFSMLDDNFSLIKKRTLEICELIIERRYPDILLNCNNGVRADRVDREVLSKMWQAGFRYIAFGVEGGNNKILKNLNKGETIETIEEAIRTALEIGFRVTLFFLVGSPGETIDDIQDSINLALKYPIFDARFYNLIPFPATELYHWVNEHNYFVQHSRHYLNSASQWDMEPVFQTPELDTASRRSALLRVKNVRKQIRIASMQREFQRFGALSGIIAKIYVNEWVQARLLHQASFRRTMKRLYLKLTSTGEKHEGIAAESSL
jgi:radical SAM superfamily enzyme YgiQ (UPF0313 family)